MSQRRRHQAQRNLQQQLIGRLRSPNGLVRYLSESGNPRARLLAYQSSLGGTTLDFVILDNKLEQAVSFCSRANTPLQYEDFLSSNSNKQAALINVLKTGQLDIMHEIIGEQPEGLKTRFMGFDPSSIPSDTLSSDWQQFEKFLSHYNYELVVADYFRMDETGRNRFNVEIADLSRINAFLMLKEVKVALGTIIDPQADGTSLLHKAIEGRHVASILSLDIENDEPIPVSAWTEATTSLADPKQFFRVLGDSEIWEGRPQDLSHAIQALPGLPNLDKNDALSALREVNAGLVGRAISRRINPISLHL